MNPRIHDTTHPSFHFPLKTIYIQVLLT